MENKECTEDCKKDFCECVVIQMAMAKERGRIRNINGTLSLLKKNKIHFIKSKVENVVIINPESDNVLLSLKKMRGGFLKLKFPDKKTWHIYKKERFLEKFNK